MLSKPRPMQMAAGDVSSLVRDERGLGKRLKRALPPRLFRRLTTMFNAFATCLPDDLKYGVGTFLRRHKAPYRFIEAGDVVVQIGAPRDLLAAGRSRAVHFARLVRHGRVVVIEPDHDNVVALRQFAARHGMAATIIPVPQGAWSEKAELTFLASDKHPAANVLEGLHDIPEDVRRDFDYRRVVVPVDSVDAILTALGVATPKLVSITTNGAELRILDGLRRTIAAGCPYISLAATGTGYHAHVESLGYEYIARDDRGYCFRKLATS